MEFIDLWVSPLEDAGGALKKLEVAPKIAGESLLVSNNRNEVRRKRKNFLLVAGAPETGNQLTQLLVETRYDFMLIRQDLHPGLKVRKRAVRMSKRYETPLVFPVAPLFSLKPSVIARVRRSLLEVQKWNGLAGLCSGAARAGELRGGAEMVSIGILMGLKQEASRNAVFTIPRWIAERAEARRRQASWGIEEV